MTATVTEVFWPLIIVSLTVIAVTGGGLVVATRWCPPLGIAGCAMVAGAGAGWICVGDLARNGLAVVLGLLLFGLGTVNLRRTDQFARRTPPGDAPRG